MRKAFASARALSHSPGVAHTRSRALISWLHDCLDAERSNRGIVNLTNSAVKRRRFLDGRDQGFYGQQGWADLTPSVAGDLLSSALLYRRECELLHGSWIVAGCLDGRKIMAPVLLHRIRPEAVSGASFPVEVDGWRINPALFPLLELPADFERELEDLFGPDLPGIGAILALPRLLGEVFPGLDVTPAEAFPELEKPGELEKSASTAGLRLHAASVILLTERSPQVRGLLDEVDRLAMPDGDDLSAPLERMLSDVENSRKAKAVRSRTSWLPVHLSPAQSSLLDSAATEPLTLCHGPPGTGKTFTLAASAIEHALRDEAVLIVCRSRQAADVIERAVDSIAGTETMTLRAGDRAALAKVRDGIDLLLSGAVTQDAPNAGHASRRERELQKLLEVMKDRADDFESSLQAAFSRGRWFHSLGKGSLWERFQQWRFSRDVSARPLLMEAAGDLQELETERMGLAREHLQTRRQHLLARMLKESGVRPALRRYRNALRKRVSGTRDAALENIDLRLLFRVFPIWIVESDDLHRILPLQDGLFPLVIMDEASQCDLASALPVLQRGLRALIGGDPKQLRHLSFLADKTLEHLAEQQSPAIDAETIEKFHFRRMSLIDLVSDRASSVHFLSEHFRSRPELIAFSNTRFYGGHLRLMREVDQSVKQKPAAEVVRVQGTRDVSGINRAELDAAAAFLDVWLEDETARGGTSSVGFLSPLRAQADGLEPVLLERIGRERFQVLLHRHGLVSSTAHGFQGDERDLMLLSFGLGDGCPAATRRFIEREDVFNVSITRARNRLVAFVSFNPANLPVDSLLRDWLGSLIEMPAAHAPTVIDPFIGEVEQSLLDSGWTCRTGATVAGIPIDILVQNAAGVRIALDLVGQGGRSGEQVPMRQLMLLQRAGLRLLPLGIAEWRADPARCLKAIGQWFQIPKKRGKSGKKS